MTTKNQITAAPSKWLLSVAFFDKGEKGRRSVEFTVVGEDFCKPSETMKVIINQLQWEDGSGESWCFKGYLDNHPRHKFVKVEGWFTTAKRTGWINLVF